MDRDYGNRKMELKRMMFQTLLVSGWKKHTLVQNVSQQSSDVANLVWVFLPLLLRESSGFCL